LAGAFVVVVMAVLLSSAPAAATPHGLRFGADGSPGGFFNVVGDGVSSKGDVIE